MCGCRPGPGGTVICDEHAAQMIEAVSDLLSGDQYATLLPGVLTPGELAGMTSLVDNWLDTLTPEGQQQGEASR
jgi:hypothetical protein